MKCSHCGKEAQSRTHGLCGACYARKMRNGTPEYVQVNRRLGIRSCSHCGSEKVPFVRSLCKACYYRQRNKDTLDYTKVRKICCVPECEELAVVHGLCDMHRKRVERHGNENAGRPDGWGAKKTHPLHHTWQWARRSGRRVGGCGIDELWNDFWKFVDDVGDRPSERHWLRRKDETKPYSKENCEWAAPVLEKSLDTLEVMREYQRAYKLKYPNKKKGYELKKLYGLSHDEFVKMLERQEGKCAICGDEEGAIDPTSKKPRHLAVDHDHGTGKIRSLLCTNCNTGLGRFRDDKELLGKAIAYLEQFER